MSPTQGTVLVTGATGFVAKHIISTLLEAGHNVRGTVRRSSSTKTLRQHSWPKYSESQLSFIEIPDIGAEGALDSALDGVQGVIHTAAPVFYTSETFDPELLRPAVDGTKYVLESVHQNGASVKHVILTSSFSAIVDSTKGLNPGHTYTEEEWNPVTLETASKNPRLMYSLSKTVAEKAAWDWKRRVNPSFKLAAICPPMIYGPVSSDVTLGSLNQSNADIWNLISGAAKEVPPTPMPAFADVRDVAKAHVRAYELGKEGRFIPSGGRYLFGDVCEIIREKFPAIADRIPKATPEQTDIET